MWKKSNHSVTIIFQFGSSSYTTFIGYSLCTFFSYPSHLSSDLDETHTFLTIGVLIIFSWDSQDPDNLGGYYDENYHTNIETKIIQRLTKTWQIQALKGSWWYFRAKMVLLAMWRGSGRWDLSVKMLKVNGARD